MMRRRAQCKPDGVRNDDTLLLMAAIAQFALFIPVAIWAATHQEPAAEITLTRLLQKKQTQRSRHLIHIVNTSLCSSASSKTLLIPIAALLWKNQHHSDALATLATNWLGYLLNIVIKHVVKRPRPSPLFVRINKARNRRSFPSGDVVSTVSLWGWISALILLSKNATRPARIIGLSLSALLITFVGPARVYMGDHWTTDVLGGYLFGGGWVCFSLYVYRKWQRLNTSG